MLPCCCTSVSRVVKFPKQAFIAAISGDLGFKRGAPINDLRDVSNAMKLSQVANFEMRAFRTLSSSHE